MPSRKRRQPGCPKITINKVQLCLRIPVKVQHFTLGDRKGIFLEIDTYNVKGYLECYPKEEYGNVDIFNRPVCYTVQVPLKECLSFIEEHLSRITHISECKTSFGVYFCKKIVLSEEEAAIFGVSFGKWGCEQIDTLNRKVSNNYTILKDQIKELLQRFGLESGNAFLEDLLNITMGFWKDVSYDMQRGMSRDRAIEVNVALRDRSITKEERDKIISKGEAEIKINSMR